MLLHGAAATSSLKGGIRPGIFAISEHKNPSIDVFDPHKKTIGDFEALEIRNVGSGNWE